MAAEKPHLKMKRVVNKGIVMFDCEFDAIQTMETREDDIWVCSYPRSGTTLTQELVYLIQTGDFETANKLDLDERVPMVDTKDDRFPYYKGVKHIDGLPSPRMIKCHLHHFMLPEQLQQGKGRIVYICRNPKDVVTSFYSLMEWIDQLEDGKATFDQFVDSFIDGTGYLCPWPKHLLGFWERRNDDNVLFLKYEDVVKDLPKAIRTIAVFLKKELTNEEVDRINAHCQFDSMKKNDKCNWSYLREMAHLNDKAEGRFMNKGKVGRWRGFLSPETNERMNGLLRELEDAGLILDEK